MMWKLMTQMQTELKQRLVIAARASEHLCTPVADSLSGKGLSSYIPKEV